MYEPRYLRIWPTEPRPRCRRLHDSVVMRAVYAIRDTRSHTWRVLAKLACRGSMSISRVWQVSKYFWWWSGDKVCYLQMRDDSVARAPLGASIALLLSPRLFSFVCSVCAAPPASCLLQTSATKSRTSASDLDTAFHAYHATTSHRRCSKPSIQIQHHGDHVHCYL